MAPPVADAADLAVFFLVGLFGGVHCIGMCGPLVGLYADRAGTDADRLTPRDVRQLTLFNLGRTLGYAAVGALVGGLGALLFDASALFAAGDLVRGVTGVLAGSIVLVAGLAYLRGGVLRHDVPAVLPGDLFGRVVAGLTARVDRWAGGPRIAGLGAAHALLPCPLLYPAYLAAFATGSAVAGALALAALGLGTIPALFIVGASLGSASAATRSRLHRALGAAFVLLALVPLTHGLSLLGLPVPNVKLPYPSPAGIGVGGALPEVTRALLAV